MYPVKAHSPLIIMATPITDPPEISSIPAYHIDPILYTGRPPDPAGRTGKELRTYDLLDFLKIPYARIDHDAMPTIEACHNVDKLLGIDICKNLFLRNAQKTDFSLLLMLGTKRLKPQLYPGKSEAPGCPLQNRNI